MGSILPAGTDFLSRLTLNNEGSVERSIMYEMFVFWTYLASTYIRVVVAAFYKLSKCRRIVLQQLHPLLLHPSLCEPRGFNVSLLWGQGCTGSAAVM